MRRIDGYQWLRNGAIGLAAALIVIALLPAFGVLVFFVRFILLGALVLGLVVVLAVPPLRRWSERRTEAMARYHGLGVAADVVLHRHHGWLRPLRGQRVEVGVDDLLQKVLGPVDRVTLPPAGQAIDVGAPLMTLSHGPLDVVVRSPVAGHVTAANPRLSHDPGLINRAPYGAGWAVRLREDLGPARSPHLRWGADAASWFRDEVDRMIAFLAPAGASPALIQDGGPLDEDLARELDEDTWRQLKARFFGDV